MLIHEYWCRNICAFPSKCSPLGASSDAQWLLTEQDSSYTFILTNLRLFPFFFQLNAPHFLMERTTIASIRENCSQYILLYPLKRKIQQVLGTGLIQFSKQVMIIKKTSSWFKNLLSKSSEVPPPGCGK